MSSGKRHARMSLALSVPLAMVVYAKTHNIKLAVSAGVGCGVIGQLVTPDLDQPSLTRSEWLVIKRVPILGWLWVAYWSILYARIPHRHWLSHAPIIGTAGRVTYMAVPLLILGVSIPVNAWTVGGVIGLGVSDLVHWVMDGFGGRK